MKSLFAVLALASALGVGYWKMQNPQGGVDEAKIQTQNLLDRLGRGVETVRSGSTVAVDKAADSAMAVDKQGQATTNPAVVDARIGTLETSLRSGQAELKARLGKLENAAESATSITVDKHLTAIDETLATAATLASDTESRTLQLEEAMADLQSGQQAAVMQESLQEQLSLQASDTTSQLAMLETTLSSNQKAAQSRLLTQLASQRAALDSQLDGIKTRVGALGAQSPRQDATDQKMVQLDEKMAALSSRLNTLLSASGTASSSDSGTEATALAAVTAQVDQRLAAIEERVTTATTADTRSNIDELQARLGASDARIAQLEEQLSSALNQSITEIDTTVNSVSTDVDTIETEVGNLKNSLAEMLASVESLSGNVDELKSTVESFAIGDMQKQLQSKLISLESRLDNAPANDISSITSALNQTRERIQALEQRVTEPHTNADETTRAMEAQTALQKQVAALETRLINTSSAGNPELASTLSAVQEQVAALEKRRYLTPEDLQRSTESIQYKIYFDKSQIAITEEAAKVLDSFIAQESNRATNISIFGTTDRTGSSEYNQQLAKRRANRVRSYLIQRGYDFSKIGAVDGIGEDLAAAELPDGQADPNLRSVIIFAYQP